MHITGNDNCPHFGLVLVFLCGFFQLVLRWVFVLRSDSPE